MGKRIYETVEASPYVAEQTEWLLRYGERLATGMLPVIEQPRHSPNIQPPPEPLFLRYPYARHHELNLALTGMLVGNLNVSLLEGYGVKQLFLNLNYIFPRTYLVASRTTPKLTPIRITGHSYFIDEHGGRCGCARA